MLQELAEVAAAGEARGAGWKKRRRGGGSTVAARKENEPPTGSK